MKNLFFNVALLSIFCTLLFSSCERQEINQQNTTNDVEKEQNALSNARIDVSKVSKKGDFLQFEDEKAFQEVLALMSQKNNKEQLEWSKQFDFISMQSIYSDVANAENELLILTGGDANKLDKEQKKRLEKYGFASEVAYKNSDIISYDKNSGFDMKIYLPLLSVVVNKKGIVKVGNAIYKHGFDNIKIIKDGDESKIDLLDKINQTDKNQNIEVIPITRGSLSNGRTETDTRTLFCESAS